MKYAIRYWSGKSTTTGEPNKRTGRMNIAIDEKAFFSTDERKKYIAKHPEWEKVNLKKLRSLNLGDSFEEFTKYIDYLNFKADYEKED